jgi:hypothetical protein
VRSSPHPPAPAASFHHAPTQPPYDSRSHGRSAAEARATRSAAKAWDNGLFDREVVPVETFQVDKQTGEETKVTVAKDDSFRANSTVRAPGGPLGQVLC